MKKISFKSIKSQLLVSFIVLILVICTGVSLIASLIAKKSLQKTVKTILPVVATQASDNVEKSMLGELKSLEALAQNEILKDPKVSIKKKMEMLKLENERYKSLGMSYITLDGVANKTDGKTFNVADQGGFQKAKAGTSNVSDPIVSKVDGSIIVIYSVPVKFNGKVVGVISSTRDGNELSTITNSIKFGTTGQAFMLNQKGTTIAHNNKDLVLAQDNDFENVKKDKALQPLVDVEKKMVAGELGTGEYSYNGKSKYVGYAPVKSTNWSIAIVIEQDEVLSEIHTLNISIGIVSIIFIVISGFIVLLIAKSITKPIEGAMNNLEEISAGNLNEEISEELLNRRDEIGKMANALNLMKDSMVEMLNDIKGSSIGIDEQTGNLSAVGEELLASSQNISVAVDDVSKGTENQAADLVDITRVIGEFSVKLDNMVRNIKDVDENTINIKTMAHDSNDEMRDLVKSVENVNGAFNDLIAKTRSVGENITKINEIIDLINSIAEQTNLLALNAAIEAARAGEAGKGFSVVAEEIRKLADQSKESSLSIANIISEIATETDLMIGTTESVKLELNTQEGNVSASIKSFERIAIAVDEIAEKMNTSSISVEELNSDKNIILEKIETSSAVAEEVSASAEEISASTKEVANAIGNVNESLGELSDMSENMMMNVNKFKM